MPTPSQTLALLPILTSEQIGVFERYARLEITFDDVRRALRGLFDCSFEPTKGGMIHSAYSRIGDERGNRWIDQRFRIPERRIVITREHLRNALAKNQLNEFSEQDLICWACMVLYCDVYDFDKKDEDFIGDSITDISYGDIEL